VSTTSAGSAETNLPQTGPSAFDDHHPPQRELLDDCVHCGFCLPTCPTYQLWGEEMDSPRGRIYLMNLADKGEIDLDGPFTEHIDACLGCLACVTACPSGVQYDKLIESVRPQIERNVRRKPADRLLREMIFALFPYKRRLRAAAVPGALYQQLRRLGPVRTLAAKLPGRLGALESLLPPVSLREAFARLPEHTPAVGDRRASVALLTGCVQDVFFHRVNAATVRVLAAEGCDVHTPRAQQCCGALELHAGREDDALARARREIEVLGALDVDYIVTNVAGCGSSMKDYGHLLADDPEWAERAKVFSEKVRDVHEVLDTLGPRAPRHPIRARVAYHDACHLAHGQQVRSQPRSVLRTIPGLEVVDIPEAAICCGSAGIYNIVMPHPASELGDRKATNIRSVKPDVVATANPGCLLQIGKHLAAPDMDGKTADGRAQEGTPATARLADTRGIRRLRGRASPDGSVPDRSGMPLLHPVQLLDASIRGVPVPRT